MVGVFLLHLVHLGVERIKPSHFLDELVDRLRRVDLVELVMLTPSGVTRLLDGLQEAGLVENVQCKDDARVTWARLTTDGVETVQCVGASHTKLLPSLFRDTMSEDEVAQLSELLSRLPGVGAGSCVG